MGLRAGIVEERKATQGHGRMHGAHNRMLRMPGTRASAAVTRQQEPRGRFWRREQIFGAKPQILRRV
jgi:hypothetical protein